MRWFAGCIAVVLTFAIASPANASSERDNPNQPAAWILVNHNTGEVLEAHNERERLRPASVTKLLTALVVVETVPASEPILVSHHAATMPAMKLDLKPGERWSRDVLLNAMLLASANDAAVALAEASAGTLDEFAKVRAKAASDLGLADAPVFNDPSGFDDVTWSHNGGDLVSARDLAIVTRAALATPEIAEIVKRQRFDFVAPNGQARYVKNHNQMLSSYAGAIGMKTGYTTLARHTFATAATRNGATYVAVVLDAPSPYPQARKLLDDAFSSAPLIGPTDTLRLTTLDGFADKPAPAVAAVSDAPSVGPGAVIAAIAIAAFALLRTRSRALRRRAVAVHG